VPATLTAAGAAAFGTYPEGAALDPVDLAFSVADCGVVSVTSDDALAESGAAAVSGDEVTPVSSTAGLAWLIWLVVALLILAALGTVVLLRRRAVSAGATPAA